MPVLITASASLINPIGLFALGIKVRNRAESRPPKDGNGLAHQTLTVNMIKSLLLGWRNKGATPRMFMTA
jgi:hypothetical protein